MTDSARQPHDDEGAAVLASVESAPEVADDADEADVATAAGTPRPPTPVPGLIALLLSATTVALLSSGISLALANDFSASSAAGLGAIGTSIAGFLLGGVAVITGRGRGWGAIAMVVSVLANPVILTNILGFVAGRTLS